jgi:hypothetical protein
MAALVASNKNTERHIFGNLAARFYTVSGNSGDTLLIAQSNIYFISVQPGSTITGVSSVAIKPGTQSQITFTASGAFTNAVVMVLSRVG